MLNYWLIHLNFIVHSLPLLPLPVFFPFAERLKLKVASEYNYLNQSECLVIDGVNDSLNFHKLVVSDKIKRLVFTATIYMVKAPFSLHFYFMDPRMTWFLLFLLVCFLISPGSFRHCSNLQSWSGADIFNACCDIMAWKCSISSNWQRKSCGGVGWWR